MENTKHKWVTGHRFLPELNRSCGPKTMAVIEEIEEEINNLLIELNEHKLGNFSSGQRARVHSHCVLTPILKKYRKVSVQEHLETSAENRRRRKLGLIHPRETDEL